MRRNLLFYVVTIGAVAMLCGPPASFAAESNNDHGEAPDLDAGHIRGRVVEIDYRRGVLLLAAADHRRLRVIASPSTTVGSGDHDADDYHAFSDVTVGAEIEVDASRRGSEYHAQSIEIEGR